MSLRAIAKQLADMGVGTAKGGAWAAAQVNDVLKRVTPEGQRRV